MTTPSAVCVTNHNHKHQSDTLRRGHILHQTQNQNEVFLELVDTERTYVRDLGILIDGLLAPLRRALADSKEGGKPSILSEEQIKALFMNVEAIHRHHKNFLHRIEWVMLWSGPFTKASTLGNLFLQECQFFQEYTPFLEGYTNALTLCETLKNTNMAFAALLKEFDSTRHRNGEMAFESILITPAQRIPRYELMFRELSRHLTDNKEVKEALDYVSKTMTMLEAASSAAASARNNPPKSQPRTTEPKEKEKEKEKRRSLSMANSTSSIMQKMWRRSTQVASSPVERSYVQPISSTSCSTSLDGHQFQLMLSQSDSIVSRSTNSTSPSEVSPSDNDTSPTSSSEFSQIPEEEGTNTRSARSTSILKSFSRKLRRGTTGDDPSESAAEKIGRTRKKSLLRSKAKES